MAENPQPQPRFVNLQVSPVMIPGPKGKTITVQPFALRNRNPKGTYVLEGEQYARYCSAKGPLYPFPVLADKDRSVVKRPAPVPAPPPQQQSVEEKTPAPAVVPAGTESPAPSAEAGGEPVPLRSRKSPPPKREQP